MIDLRVIEVRALLPITKVLPLPDFSPRTLQLYGPDLLSTSEVLINERPSPSIVIRNSNLVWAQVPTDVGGTPIRTIVAISHKISNTYKSRISFTLGDTPQYVSGTDRLVQSFLKLLLQTPGSDQFAKTLGGGVLRAAGKMQTTRGPSTTVADVQTAVDRTRSQLLAIQAQDSNLAPEERLLYARLLNAEFHAQESALYCSIDIGSHALQSTTVALEV